MQRPSTERIDTLNLMNCSVGSRQFCPSLLCDYRDGKAGWKQSSPHFLVKSLKKLSYLSLVGFYLGHGICPQVCQLEGMGQSCSFFLGEIRMRGQTAPARTLMPAALDAPALE